MVTVNRVSFEPVGGASELFTPEFCDGLAAFYDRFTPRVHALRAKRQEVLERALKEGVLPGPLLPSPTTTTTWSVPLVPQELWKPGIEISGPASIAPMFITALNPGPEGERAEGDLDDDEDSACHRLIDTVQAAKNRLQAVSSPWKRITWRRVGPTKFRTARYPSSCTGSGGFPWMSRT